MNILMVTNVYTPQIGGVTRSVQQFSDEYRAQGHKVLVIAPEYEEIPAGETDVLRVPAIPKFYQKVYPLPLPVMSTLIPDIREFSPHIVHVHHPFLLGSTGQLIAADRNIPLVYTHHTRYSVYVETKTNWPRPVEEGLVELIVGFCNLCNGVVAPSEDIAGMLRNRGVEARIEVIPTGVNVEKFSGGNAKRFRDRLGVSDDTFVVLHVGRISVEKNCRFLARAVAAFLRLNQQAVFVVVGDGPEVEPMREYFQQTGVIDRVHFLGFLENGELIDAYHGGDVFAFASHSETQGMVLGEAMAAGTPVVAVEGTGVRDIVIDQQNGRMIPRDDVDEFVDALQWVAEANGDVRDGLRRSSLETADSVSQQRCASSMLDFYSDLIRNPRPALHNDWERMQQRWEASWQRWRSRAKAVATAAKETFQSPG